MKTGKVNISDATKGFTSNLYGLAAAANRRGMIVGGPSVPPLSRYSFVIAVIP